jgi:HPt (histidine-containing phosphotransfer) domain-containing protein
VFDRAEALRHVGGDEALLRELGDLFFRSCPDFLSELREAIAENQPKAVQRVAHLLKGGISHMGARGVYNAALRLEEMGRAGSLAGADTAYRALEESLDRLRPVLTGAS